MDEHDINKNDQMQALTYTFNHSTVKDTIYQFVILFSNKINILFSKYLFTWDYLTDLELMLVM